jgi:hypothetical protein
MHPRCLWRPNWTVLVTLTGRFLLTLGLLRMFAASLYRQQSAEASSSFFIIGESILFALALVITVRAYARDSE